MTNTFFAFASTITAVVALGIAVMSWLHARRVSVLTGHYELVSGADQMSGHEMRLLRFHGIDTESIEETYGVSAVDVAYLLQSFNAGSVAYQIEHGRFKRIRPFPTGSYRYNILMSESTRLAFPLLIQLFDPNNAYMACCAATIREIEES